MDWLSADVVSLAAALGSPGTPVHPVLHGSKPVEHHNAPIGRPSAASGDHPSTSMLPSLQSEDPLAISPSSFSPRAWGLDLAEPLPDEDSPPPGAPDSPGRSGHRGAAGLTPRQHSDGPLDLSLQRGQPLRFVSGVSSDDPGRRHSLPASGGMGQHQQQHQQWQYKRGVDGRQPPPPPPQQQQAPLKRKPGRPRGGAKVRLAEPDGYHRPPMAAEDDPDLWNNVRRTVSSVNYARPGSRSFEEDGDSPPAKRSRRSTARAMESAELEAMDVFGDKEDEEDRWRAAKGRSSVTESRRLSLSLGSGGGSSGTTVSFQQPLPVSAAVAAADAGQPEVAPAPPKRRGRPPRDASKQVHGPQQEIERLREELVRAHSINGRLQLQVQALSREVLRLRQATEDA